MSPLNYAGHKLYKHAIDLLHSSGEEYIEYLKSKSYQKDDVCDIEGSIQRGIMCSRATGLELQPDYNVAMKEHYKVEEVLQEYKFGPKVVTNPISKEIINRIIQEISQISIEANKDGVIPEQYYY